MNSGATLQGIGRYTHS